ncbi:MAG: CDP-glycerol glycerophosphotransferase family protein [Defluviitaleaceae bacterium]|nr:CDP-glycerol glycerophosphotransferase family protein [Defluviitaleaceae bacterium]MCL2274414.1 CDP-glycerol glycerophosphotransferase family protein [Defluviitaleaceae bacterium]
MRKIHHQQILDVLETIIDAQDKQQYSACQDGAEAIIDFIASYGNDYGANTIKLLEQYFELLYKTQIGDTKPRILYKHLSKILTSVETELKPNRIEVAFISHKAAMSDSIESIYLAAKADPDCDAFFIPVPYYEHGKDGKPEVLKFEGAEHYSPNIDCINWEMYDIEARRPDAIFTFNAYDGDNKVSSIHPNFYSEKLRAFTNMLVLVPYRVASDKHKSPSWAWPGCINAHRVVMESELQRRYNIEKYKQDVGELNGAAEEKFIALGNPKYDKVYNTRREDCYLPPSWKNKIGDKKVILYISSIGSALANANTYLQKLAQIMTAFYTRNDVVLWWRPHPLLAATFHSMMPILSKTYNDMVKKFKQEDWGIFDDTGDLNRAIAMSDGCYGDGGSIYSLYWQRNKPFLLADFVPNAPELIEKGHMVEGSGLSLQNYIDGIIDESIKSAKLVHERALANPNGQAGKAIYNYVKEEHFK